MIAIMIACAFVFGFAVRQFGLPPMIGFLLAGFTLSGFIEGSESLSYLDKIADLGIYLLLFSIGLKLDLKSLFRPEIWGVASIHMLVTTLVLACGVFGLSWVGLGVFADLDYKTSLLVAFALSFSSTVFAVKVLEEKGEMSSQYGQVSIGILIMQDIFAIIFLTVSTGKTPSPWALLFLGLPVVRRLLIWLMNRCGHGELLVLLGLLFVFGFSKIFEVVQLKPDLGALIAGVLISGVPKSKELSNALLSFKDLFLVGFFLSIGLKGAPGWAGLGVASLLVLVIPLKVMFFYWLMSRFKLRSRTSLLGSLNLANYSEFGLIVAALGNNMGWLDDQWVVILAVALSISFVLAAPINSRSHQLYLKLGQWLKRFESRQRLASDEPIDLGGAEIIIFGMGRIGAGAYETMMQNNQGKVIGLDNLEEAVLAHQEAGRRVVKGDATDTDLYEKMHLNEGVRMVMLTMSNCQENQTAAMLLRQQGYSGKIAAVAKYLDEIDQLKASGVDEAFNIYAEAGAGFADRVCSTLSSNESS